MKNALPSSRTRVDVSGYTAIIGLMKVSEIFRSVESEGLRMGQATVMVRLYGCNLRCDYCDTMYAVEGGKYKTMSVVEIVEAVKAYRKESGVKCVTLTGGEPLQHPGVGDLISVLCESGFLVNVETNGTASCRWRLPGLFYTMGWKCKSSGMSSEMRMKNIETLGAQDVLKFVVGSIEDLEEAESVVARLLLSKMAQFSTNVMPHIFVSPVYGVLTNEQVVEWMLASKIMTANNARFQVQLHKVIWTPDRRSV